MEIENKKNELHIKMIGELLGALIIDTVILIFLKFFN